MRSDILLKIRNDPRLENYLKYNSYWYKELLINPDSIRNMESEMKKEYKLTLSDKINNMTLKVEMIRSFMDVFK